MPDVFVIVVMGDADHCSDLPCRNRIGVVRHLKESNAVANAEKLIYCEASVSLYFPLVTALSPLAMYQNWLLTCHVSRVFPEALSGFALQLTVVLQILHISQCAV